MDSVVPVPNRRPGKLWAVLQFPLTRFLLGCIAIFIWIFTIQISMKLGGVHPHSPLGAVLAIVLAVGVLVIYTCLVHFIEKRPVVELAAKGAQRHAARGILIGAALFGMVMLVLKFAGAWTYLGMDPLSYAAYPFVGALFAGIMEETIFRGLLFRILEENLGSWIALALAAVLFGLAHAFNPGISAVKATVVITLEAGILLAAAYMYTRSLWFVMGLHFAWNFTEGGVFATSVSGTGAGGVIAVRFSGSDLVTGGEFGPEASLPAVLIGLAAGVAFAVFAARSGRIVRPSWARQK
jgi:membrane protease YdiL (CAAX protease family)